MPSSKQDLADLDVSALLTLYRNRSVSPVEVTRAVLSRIEALQPKFNAFRFVDAEGALGIR